MAMATVRSSPSAISCDHASSTPRDQSDIELVPLVPPIHNPTSEQPRQSSATILGGLEHVRASSDKTKTKRMHGGASSTRPQPLLLQSGTPSIVRRLLLDTWLCEAVAMTFSMVCLAAIVFVVGAFDGERIPQLVSGLTLNAIISVLSTASRASLIFVVSATMGQLKWCWLKRSGRQVHDIQTMDDASRGLLGAFGVLAFWTGGSLAALGSIITLLIVVFSPFLQQLVEYPSRNITQPHSIALAPRNLAYTRHTAPISVSNRPPWEDNAELVDVIEAGIWSVPKPFDQEPTCSTGQCSWPKFQSVGWCSKCEDRTHLATLDNCTVDTISQNKNRVSEYCVLSLGNGANFSLFRDLAVEQGRVDGNFTSEVIWPLSYGNSGTALSILNAPELSSRPERLLGVLNPLIAIGHAFVEFASDPGGSPFIDTGSNALQVIQASQCILNPCEKTLSVVTVNGTTTWSDELLTYGNLIARNVSFTDSRGPGEPTIGLTTLCWQAEDGDLDLTIINNENYAVDRSKRAFCPMEDYAFSIQKSLQGRYHEKFAINIADHTAVLFGFDDDNSRYEYASGRSNAIGPVGPESTRNLSQRVESIAIALSNYGLQTTNDTITGEAIAEESYVRVRWQWIVLPTFLELASCALFILTIIHSRREDVPLWKSSVLALIYHAVDELRGQETLATERLSGMEITAKTAVVQLVKSEDGLNSLSKRLGYREMDQDG